MPQDPKLLKTIELFGLARAAARSVGRARFAGSARTAGAFTAPLTMPAEQWRHRIDPKPPCASIQVARAVAAAPAPAARPRLLLERRQARPRRPPAPPRSAPLATLDALLAVQGEGDPAERRRRSVAPRARISSTRSTASRRRSCPGRIATANCSASPAQLAERRDVSGDPGLDELVAAYRAAGPGRAREARRALNAGTRPGPLTPPGRSPHKGAIGGARRRPRDPSPMLFNSFAFLLAFLPAALLLHWARRALPAGLAAAAARRSSPSCSTATGTGASSRCSPPRSLVNWLDRGGVRQDERRRPHPARASPATSSSSASSSTSTSSPISRPDPGPAGAAARHRAAARHLVLHLPPRHVPDGPEGRARAALRPRPLRPLHRLLPAGSRRPAGALERDHAPVRRAPLRAPGRGRALRARADAADRRPRQEGLPRRPARRIRQPGLRRRRRRARPSPSPRPGRGRSASPSRSISTSPATPTWRSASRCCSASCCRRISTRPTAPSRCRISGGAGT